MQKSDVNSVLARARYRVQRQLKKVRQRVTPAQATPPAYNAQSGRAGTDVPDPRFFQQTTKGSGTFGEWILDEANLPAYRYQMNHLEDEKAKYPVSTGAFRRDHWHQIGNDRITALASNDGVIQVMVGEQGFMYLNYFSHGALISTLGTIWAIILVLIRTPAREISRFFLGSQEPGLFELIRDIINAPGADRRDDLQHAYAGGFGYIQLGDEVWSTAYRYQPKKICTHAERIFGMGYYHTVCEHKGIKVARTVYAPGGDASALLSDVEITNTSETEQTLSYYEYWDINIQQITLQLLRTGEFGAAGDAKRRRINREFTPCIVWDDEAKALRFHLHPPENSFSPGIPAEINYQPLDIFLADLSGTPDGMFTDKVRFFGEGGAMRPDAIGKWDTMDIERIKNTIMPYCMVLRREVTIPAGETRKLRFAYGTVEPTDYLSCDERTMLGYSEAQMPEEWMTQYQLTFHLSNTSYDPLQELHNYWREKLTYFAVVDEPQLQREMAWHTYYLLSSTLYNQFFGVRVVPQGSAYLYLHGIDGAPRDFALYVLSLAYVAPALARDLLCFIMQMTEGYSGQIAYCYTGNGHLSGAIIHTHPSDLDLFFLMGVNEYIRATGDYDFLNQQVPFYAARNQPRNQKVINHVILAYHHLMHVVGLGDNNLIRVRDGDWSDDVVIRNIFPFNMSVSPRNTVLHGESVTNSQMALYVLPRTASLLMNHPDEEINDLGTKMQVEVDEALERIREGLKTVWQETYYARAILRTWRNQNYVLRKDRADLEAQVWALIGDIDPDTTDTLKETIYKKLDEPSNIGATMANGSVWPAVAQLLTWGYTRRYPDLAWQSFLKQTMTNRAEVFPDHWFNIWSGPDGVNGPLTEDPGGTYQSPPATPMTDFPVMNNNQHAMALLAMLRVCGIEVHESDRGICIAPQIPERYKLDVALIQLDVTPKRISGTYRAHNNGDMTLHIRLAAANQAVKVDINDASQTMQPDSAGFVQLKLPPFKRGDAIKFAVTDLPG